MLDIIASESLSAAEQRASFSRRLTPPQVQVKEKIHVFRVDTSIGDAFCGGRVDEAAFRDLVDWQIDEGSNGLVPVRHDRRGRDAVDRRASPPHRDHGRGGAGPRAGDRRLRLEQHRSCDRADQGREGGRRRCRAACAALLQPAEPGRHLRSSGGGRRARHPDHPLQRAVAHDHRHSGRNDGAAVAAAQRHRGQGRDRQSGARFGPAAGLRRGVRPALRQ